MAPRWHFMSIAVLFVLSLTVHGSAQQETVSISDWRVEHGDNPAWAKRDFDDSRWTQTAFIDTSISFNFHGNGTRWYRAAFQVSPAFAQQDLAIGMGPVDEVYDVYLEGALVGRFGFWEPRPHSPFPRHMVFPLPAGLLKDPVGHIAVRRWRSESGVRWSQFSASGYFSFPHPPEIGPRTSIETLEQLHPAAGAIRQLFWVLTDLLFLIAAVISFVLYSTHRRKMELLCLGLYCILSGGPPLLGIMLATSNTVMTRSWGPVLIFFFSDLSDSLSLLFLAYLCLRFRKGLQFGAAIAAVFAFVGTCGYAGQSLNAILAPIYWSNYAMPVFELLAMWDLFRSRNRGSFAIACTLLLETAVWGWGALAIQFHLPLQSFMVDAGPFRIDFRALPGIVFVFVTLLVLYLRYRDERIRLEAIDKDLAAAQRMQEHLLAGSDMNPSGFKVEAIYRPARSRR